MADDAEADAPRTESRGQMLQRHKRELADVKSKIARLGKKQKEEGDKMLKELTARHEAQLAALVRELLVGVHILRFITITH